MKATVHLDDADIEAAVRHHLEAQGYRVAKVRVEGHHDPGDGPHGPRSWVTAEADVEPTPRPPRPPEHGEG